MGFTEDLEGRKYGPTRGKDSLNSMNGGDGMECLICQSTAWEKDGLNFWGVTICGDCEGRLMELAVDQPEYDTIVRAFRLLWQRQLSDSSDRHLVDGEQR